MRSTLPAALLWATLAAGCEAPATPDAAAELHALFDETWEQELAENPLFATFVGRHEWNDRLPSAAPEDHERRAEQQRRALERLTAIDRSRLGEQDRVSYDIFEREQRDRLAAFEHREHLMPLTSDSGFHTGFALLPDRVPFATVADYENYLARLRALPRYTEQHIELLRLGLAAGLTLPRVVLAGYETTIAPHVVDDVTESVFWHPFERFPPAVPETDRERLRQAGRAAVAASVVPAYRAFLDFMLEEYIPGARETLGASELPGGEAWYTHLVRHHTTLDVTPAEVHEIGLGEVERIRGEILEILGEVGFDGDLAAFLEHLRTDPRFFARTPQELLERAAWIAKRMDGKLPALFSTLPRWPYTVEPVPDHLAPKYTTGRYVSAPEGGTRPGIYWVNTHALESRPLWALPALTLHEAVPGHHFEDALGRERQELPEFRRFGGFNAFSEGWGLYSEWLGLEVGIYQDPYDRFGRLTYEMWRACRLVVDTGLHAFGWSREQAMEYMAANTSLSRHEITTETDRYISWPGQALAYKMGEIELRRLRREAEEALGTRFDVRLFHDQVLRHGSVPLPVLRRQVEAWIEKEREP